MAKSRGIGQIYTDLERQINSDYNDLIQMIAKDLPKVSPKDTGFFASSWKASTQRPQNKDDKKDFAPWSKYERGKKMEDVRPRYKVPVFNYKKQPTVYIGNTVVYARSALVTRNPLEANSITGYVQGEMGALVAEAFREKKAGRIFAFTGQEEFSPKGYERFGEIYS
jgi:hypothetical protein